MDNGILDENKSDENYDEIWDEIVIPWMTWEDMIIPFEKDKTPDDGILEDKGNGICDEMILFGDDGTLKDESESDEIYQYY
jgi:hypothetical protein